MEFKEHLQISRRAIKTCFHLEKYFTSCLFLDSFLSAITSYIPIYFSAKVIDALCDSAGLTVIIKYVLLTVGLVFVVRLLNTYISSVKDIAEASMYRHEDWMYSEKAMQMAYESIEDPEVKRLRYRIRRETQTGYNCFYLYRVIERLTSEITQIVTSAVMVSSFFALSNIPLGLKLGMIAGLIVSLYITYVSTDKSNQLEKAYMASFVDMNILGEQFSDYISDYSSGKDIRLYGMGNYIANSYLEIDASLCKKSIENSYKKALWLLPQKILEHGFKYGVYIILIFTAIKGGISVGSIAKYASCIMLLISAIKNMITTLQISFENHHYLKRYFSYFDIPNNMYKGTLTVEKRDDNEYYVEFKNVSFKYPNTESYALRHVNLKFKVGEKLAIVGKNGSGKTTFIKLLCRLYDPTEGEILLNGVNIQKYDYDEYMSIFSVVFQDFQLFDFKLGEVVASGKNFDRDKVRECLVKANYGERYEELPDGVDTYLYKGYDKSGIEISGGEAQKIALARALYKDAPFILLDEPTAALDPISEYEVYSNFNAISGDKTAVYISHRLASCRFCDKIAVFDHGQIVQVGSHESLVADDGGKYHELWHAQAQYYTKTVDA